MQRMLFVTIVLSSSVLAQRFETGCTPEDLPSPLKEIARRDLPIDEKCGIEGSGTTVAKQLESRAKNNYRAQSAPADITPGTLRSLQRATDQIAGLEARLQSSRDVLQGLVSVAGATIGEGSPVRMVAFLSEAHHSNVSKGELVNCKLRGKASNDIHIALTATANEDDECKSFTAEMTPHFRPEEWEEVTTLRIGNRPVRLTGALFFDSSHEPCRGTKRSRPMRASVWEIHPVYSFDICRFRSKSKCRIGDSAVWVPLHEWVGEGVGEDH